MTTSAPTSRAAVFLASLGAAHAPAFRDAVGLETKLEELLSRCREAWPGLALDETAFLRHLADRLSSGGRSSEGLDGLHVTDLYLACACMQGNAAAITAFERRFFPEAAEAVARVDATGALTDEVLQLLRGKLLVADEEAPKIATYSGRGPLAGWVCAAAIRTALTQLRSGRREVLLEDEQLLDMPSEDPELEFIRLRYRSEFRTAFQDAFQSLSSQERNVLRLYLVDGLNIDEIGSIYRAHRSTVARWIARCRRTLFEGTRQALATRFNLSPSELDSLMRVLDSDLDVSITRFLRTGPS